MDRQGQILMPPYYHHRSIKNVRDKIWGYVGNCKQAKILGLICNLLVTI